MTTAEKILGALEVERMASGYYAAAAAAATTVEAPDFASVDTASGVAELAATAPMAFAAEQQPQIFA